MRHLIWPAGYLLQRRTLCVRVWYPAGGDAVGVLSLWPSHSTQRRRGRQSSMHENPESSWFNRPCDGAAGHHLDEVRYADGDRNRFLGSWLSSRSGHAQRSGRHHCLRAGSAARSARLRSLEDAARCGSSIRQAGHRKPAHACAGRSW